MSDPFTTLLINQIPTHLLPTDKYKTNSIAVYIRQPLEEEHYTKVALIPQILQRGTMRYPSAQKLRQALDDLYGATLQTDVVKRGEEQIIVFRLQIANETYLSDTTPLFAKGIELLSEVLQNPLLENGVFHSRHVELEKDLLARKLSQIKDDKVRYANKRCTEEMFKNERYRLFSHGSIDQLEQLTPQSLYDYYQKMIRSHPIDCFIIGDLEQNDVQHTLSEHFSFPREAIIEWPRTEVVHEVTETREITEKMPLSQGKLHIGCRTQTAYADDDYVPLLVFNGVFGGFSHSKLFRNVREKESLAYYVSSHIESHKGFMMIMSGIDVHNDQKTVKIIREELDKTARGEITDDELAQTKAMLINQIMESNDQPFQLMERHYQGIVGGRKRSSSELMSDIRRVSKEDVQRMARKVQMDTIYFLTSEGEAR